jgi:hypothetical protein
MYMPLFIQGKNSKKKPKMARDSGILKIAKFTNAVIMAKVL